MFPKTDDGHFDMGYFLNKHVPMVEALLEEAGLVRIDVEEGVSIPTPGPAVVYTVLASLTFNSYEALEGAMRSYGVELRADFPNFTNVEPHIQVNRVKTWSPKVSQEHIEKRVMSL
jgi:uncharacterized protein (TIGR02118 family)